MTASDPFVFRFAAAPAAASLALLASLLPVGAFAGESATVSPAQLATQINAQLAQWRSAVAVGVDTSCGKVIGLDAGKLIVQRPDAAKVIPVAEVYPPGTMPCLLDVKATAPGTESKTTVTVNQEGSAPTKPEANMSCYLDVINWNKPNEIMSVRAFDSAGKPRQCVKGGVLKIGTWISEYAVMTVASKICDLSKPMNKMGGDSGTSGTTMYCSYAGAVAPGIAFQGVPIRAYPDE